MKKEITVVSAICSFILIGCGDRKPTEDEAFKLAKQEMSMALCGDKSASCFFSEGGKTKISEKKIDGTYNASVTFSVLKGSNEKLPYDQGVVFLDIDGKSKEAYVKSIEAWSDDGSRSIKLCGHNYKFCRT